MTVDRYAGGARRWAEGASLVYGPIARQLIATSPHPLCGRVVDIGEGGVREVKHCLVEAIRPIMPPYQPTVVFLSGLVPDMRKAS